MPDEDQTERRIKKAFYTAKEVIQFVVAAVTVVVAIVTFVNTTQRSTARALANTAAIDSLRNQHGTEMEDLERNLMARLEAKANNFESHEEHENLMRRIDNSMAIGRGVQDLIDGRDGIAERVLLLEERTGNR